MNLLSLIVSFSLLAQVALFAALTTEPKSQPQQSVNAWLEKAKAKISKQVLPNGLTTIHYPLPGSNKVYVSVTYNAGAKNELPTEHGLAHMVEHMIFKGTEKMSERDLDAIAEKFCIGGIGVGFNAGTYYDITNYYFKTDKNNWPVFVNMLADCMENACFKEHHFASEVKAVAQEMKMRNARPSTCIFDTLGHELLPPNHPYAHPLGGNLKTLLNSNAQDLKAFYQRHYAPANALVTIVGDCDAEQAFAQVQEAFGTLENPYFKQDTQTPNPVHADFFQKNTTVYKPVPNPVVRYCWLTPGDLYEREIAAPALSYALSLRFEKKIKDKKDLVYSIGASPITFNEIGYFMISFEPKENTNGVQTKSCKEAIEHELRKIMTKGITEEELACFKKISITSVLKAFDSAQSVANLFEQQFFKFRNEFEIFNDIAAVENLTQDTIKNFCKNYLQPYLMHTFTVMPLLEEQKETWQTLQAALDTYEQTALAQKIRENEVEQPRLSDQMPEPTLLTLTYEHPDKKITLSNGLDVYLKYRDISPFVCASLSFKNSEQLDIALRNSNLAHAAQFAVNLLSEGSEDYSKQEHQAFFDLLGASWNMSYGRGSFSCLPEDLMLVADRFVHILTRPTYPENIFTQEQADAIDRIKQAQDNSFYLAQSTVQQYLFQGYPWIKTDEQTIQELAAIQRDDLFALHKRFVNPRLMFLTIVGNFDQATIIEQLEQTFGLWQQNQSFDVNAEMPAVPDISNPQATSLHKFLPKEQVALVAGRVTTTFDTDDRFCLKLLELYLNKCLYEIRERTGIFYSCSGSLSSTNYLTKGNSCIGTLVSIDNVELAQEAIKNVLQTICTNGIDEKNLAVAKQNYQVTLAKGFSTNVSLAESYASLVQINMPWTHYDDCIERVHRLSCDDVNRVAKQYLDPTTWSFITVGRTYNNARA
ncbi:insulinase family protein [Candidatus Babeliales bacterium]|nr:insulinase family protein [Candidatus Babeliales bacterium]